MNSKSPTLTLTSYLDYRTGGLVLKAMDKDFQVVFFPNWKVPYKSPWNLHLILLFYLLLRNEQISSSGPLYK